jgi:2-phospho-L-lactate transferase/gluconeogenesis factor (CofD/UPF0052 family)
MSLSYAWEKFYTAVLGMATSAKSLPERIEDAYVYNVIHVRDEDVPQDHRWDFQRLKEMVTCREARHSDEGTVRSTTQQMSVQEAEEAAHLIIKLFDEISSAHREVEDRALQSRSTP